MQVPMFIVGAVLLGLIFDLPAKNIVLAAIGAGIISFFI